MGRWTRVAALSATTALLAGCGVDSPGSGLTATRVESQTGKACPTTRRATGTLLTSTGRTRWRVALRLDNDGASEPVASRTTVFADTGGQVDALAAATGHRLWRRGLGSDVNQEWLTPSGLVVDVSQTGDAEKLVDVDPATGRTLWSYQAGGQGFYGNVTISGTSLVAVAEHPTRLLAVDIRTGRVRWSHKLNVPSQPVTGAGVVAVDPAGTLHGYSLQTGRQLWHVIRTDPFATLYLDRGTVVVQPLITGDRTPVAGYAIADGRLRWKLGRSFQAVTISTTGAGLVMGPAESPGKGALVLLDPETGKVLWKDAEGRGIWQADPVVAGKYLATIEASSGVDATSRLQYRDLATGRLVADRLLGRRVFVAGLTAAGSKSVWLTGDGKEGLVQSYQGRHLAWSAHIPVFTVDPVIRVRGHGLFVQSEDPGCAVADQHGKG